LGVFDALADGERTAGQVAEACGLDPVGAETFLNALNGFGYVRRRDGRYRLTRASAKWLTSASKDSQVEPMLFFADLWDAIASIEDGVRTGVPLEFHHAERPPEFWEHYMRALAQFAALTASELTRRVRFHTPPRRLLDVGGGHGAYSAAFCRRYPTLSAEVLDLPPAAAQGRAIVAALGASDRVAFREGDLRTADWGEDYDVVLIFNVLHNLTEDESRQAFCKARAALRPGGTLVVMDSEHTGGGGELSTTSGFNELFFFVVSGTRAYPEGTMLRWVREAGFSSVRLRKLLTVPDEVFVTAEVP
jgi:SAM-dependent methyltransferase